MKKQTKTWGVEEEEEQNSWLAKSWRPAQKTKTKQKLTKTEPIANCFLSYMCGLIACLGLVEFDEWNSVSVERRTEN